MTLEEIFELWGTDCKIDKHNLGEEALNIPELHNKYLKMYYHERVKSKAYGIEERRLKGFLYQYYCGDFNNKDDEATILKTNNREPWTVSVSKNKVDIFIGGDKEMVSLNKKKGLTAEKVSCLEEIIRMINTRGYQIKSAIDFEKWSQGSY